MRDADLCRMNTTILPLLQSTRLVVWFRRPACFGNRDPRLRHADPEGTSWLTRGAGGLKDRIVMAAAPWVALRHLKLFVDTFLG